nr:unnamed protein product [Callosobruchus analis]
METDNDITSKRKRKPESWRVNIRKKCKAEGNEYSTKKGKLIPAHSTGTTCSLGAEKTVLYRSGYESLFGVGEKRIRRLSEVVTSGVPPIDQRGKHNNRPLAKSIDLKQSLISHIAQFAYQVLPYGKVANKHRYLSSSFQMSHYGKIAMKRRYHPL